VLIESRRPSISFVPTSPDAVTVVSATDGDATDTRLSRVWKCRIEGAYVAKLYSVSDGERGETGDVGVDLPLAEGVVAPCRVSGLGFTTERIGDMISISM